LIHEVVIVIMFGHKLELDLGLITLVVHLLNIRVLQYKMETG